MKPFSKFVTVKEAHDLLYLSEAFDKQITTAKDVDGLDDWSAAHKKELKKIFNFLKKNFPNVTVKSGFGLIAAGSGSNAKKGEFKISDVLKDAKFGKKKLTADYVKKELVTDLKFQKFGSGSKGGKGDSKIYKDFGIPNATAFIEFFQASGFFVSSALTEKNFVSVLKGLKVNGDFELLSNDWNGFVVAMSKEKATMKNVIELVNGSYYFKKDVGVTNPHVVHKEIKAYYQAMLSFEKDIDFTKDNTADIVVIENGKKLSDLKSALEIKGQTLSIDEKVGKLATTKKPKVSWYQVSLKETESGARLGRLTTIFKNLYLEPDDKEAGNLAVATGESYDKSLNNFVELFNEGWFDNVKVFAKKVIDAVKEKVLALKKIVSGWFNYFFKQQKLSNWKSETKSVLGDIQKIIDNNKVETKEEFEKRTGKNYVDRIAKYKRALGESFLTEKAGVEDQIDALFKNKKSLKEFTKLVQSRLDVVEKAAKKNSGVHPEIVRIKGSGTTKAKIARDTIKMNLGNSLSFAILETMIKKFPSKNIMQYVSAIKDDMMMGSTNYPVVKLYGSEKKANYSILTRTVTKEKINTKQIKPLIVSIDGKNGQYYVINVYMISKADPEPEKCLFNLLQFTNAGGGFAYKIEGNKTVDYTYLQKTYSL